MPFDQHIKKKVSVVIVCYNMARELPRTVQSLSPPIQRNLGAEEYELIVVDNGSSEPPPEDLCRRWAPNLTVHRMARPTPSPVPAINKGLELANGELIGVFIDGARMASPGLLAMAYMASRLHERPVIGTLAFHIGPEVQMESVKKGYNQAIEDRLLQSCEWEQDAYRLFAISVFAGSSAKGWFVVPAETNALFLKAAHWRELGGYDPAFVTPGGGLANLDIWERLCTDANACVIMLLGEATFHQVHGGIATNTFNPPQKLFHAEYQRIRGRPFVKPQRRPVHFGSLTPFALPTIETSAALARSIDG